MASRPDEYDRQRVAELLAGGGTTREVALATGLHRATVDRWKAQAGGVSEPRPRTKPLDAGQLAVRERIARRLAAGQTFRGIQGDLCVGAGTVAAVKRGGVTGLRLDEYSGAPRGVRAVKYDDKRVPSATYDDFIKNARINQAFKRSVGWSQSRVGIDLRDRTEPALILGLSDLHAGSWGSDLDTLDRFTRFVKAQNGRVLVALVGDLLNLAIKLRGVLEV